MSRQQCWFMSIEAYFLGEFLVLKHETYIHGYAVMFATIRMVFTLENILWKAFIQCNCQYKVTDNVTARHKNCPSSAFDDHLGRDLFRVLMRPPISQPLALGLTKCCSNGKARATRPDSDEDCIHIGVFPCYCHYAECFGHTSGVVWQLASENVIVLSKPGVTNLFAIADHFVSYCWVSGLHNSLVILWNLLNMKNIVHQQKQTVSPICFAGRTTLFCRPHVCHLWSKQNTSQALYFRNSFIEINSWQCCLLCKKSYITFSWFILHNNARSEQLYSGVVCVDAKQALTL